MLNLPVDLAYVGSNQAQLARHVGVSRAAITQIIKYRIWPSTRGLNEALLRERISAYLKLKGLPPERLVATFDEAPAAPRANAELQAMAQATHSGPQTSQFKDEEMLPRKHTITPDARDYFTGRAALALPKTDPFPDDRRTCDQCANLIARRCQAAKRGEIVASQNYEPIRDLPRRCEGYAPGEGDTDRRPGRERWPGLTDTKGTK